MKRYWLDTIAGFSFMFPEEYVDEPGQWVKYEDAQKEIEKLLKENAELLARVFKYSNAAQLAIEAYYDLASLVELDFNIYADTKVNQAKELMGDE